MVKRVEHSGIEPDRHGLPRPRWSPRRAPFFVVSGARRRGSNLFPRTLVIALLADTASRALVSSRLPLPFCFRAQALIAAFASSLLAYASRSAVRTTHVRGIRSFAARSPCAIAIYRLVRDISRSPRALRQTLSLISENSFASCRNWLIVISKDENAKRPSRPCGSG